MAKQQKSAIDYDEHARTYVTFVRLITWSVAITLAVVALMGLFLL